MFSEGVVLLVSLSRFACVFLVDFKISLNSDSTAYTNNSTDCLVYTRGSVADYDRYASVTGDPGWSWANLLPYFKKSERFTASADRHNATGEFNPAVHGFDGLNSVSLPGAPTGIDGKVAAALEELGGEFEFNEDTNSGSPLGFGE